MYNKCANLLAGYTPLEARKKQSRSDVTALTGNSVAAPPVGVDATDANKRARHEFAMDASVPAYDAMVMQPSIAAEAAAAAAAAASAMIAAPRARGAAVQVQPEGEDTDLPTNAIFLPAYYTSGGGMDEATLANFRNSFYLRLTKNQADASNIDGWHPPVNNANLKSKAQLAEWIHIATHWNTGADGLDAGAFRAKHKTFYSRMKPKSHNLGRRTGLHLRQLSGGGGEGGGSGMTVLCRYNKAGTKSIVYLDAGRLFDALFQIHALELNHRGRDATKNVADERFANVPDTTVRAFLETCPQCSIRRSAGQFSHQAQAQFDSEEQV